MSTASQGFVSPLSSLIEFSNRRVLRDYYNVLWSHTRGLDKATIFAEIMTGAITTKGAHELCTFTSTIVLIDIAFVHVDSSNRSVPLIFIRWLRTTKQSYSSTPPS